MAAIRGGNFNNDAIAGVFYLNVNNAPSNSNYNIGFRACKVRFRARRAEGFSAVEQVQIHAAFDRHFGTGGADDAGSAEEKHAHGSLLPAPRTVLPRGGRMMDGVRSGRLD